MKKTIAMILAVVLMLMLSAAAFAETELRGYMEWNEEKQMYEIRVYEVETGPCMNPNPPVEDYQQHIRPISDFDIPFMIDWRDY